MFISCSDSAFSKN